MLSLYNKILFTKIFLKVKTELMYRPRLHFTIPPTYRCTPKSNVVIRPKLHRVNYVSFSKPIMDERFRAAARVGDCQLIGSLKTCSVRGTLLPVFTGKNIIKFRPFAHDLLRYRRPHFLDRHYDPSPT